MKNFFRLSVTLSVIWLLGSMAIPYMQQQSAELPSAADAVKYVKEKIGA